MPQSKHSQKSPKFYVYWQLLVTSQVLKAIVANQHGITSILHIGMSLQNVVLPSVHADRVNTPTWSWLLHSKPCRCCGGACVPGYILQESIECSGELLEAAQPNPTLPGWKRSISLDYVVCIEGGVGVGGWKVQYLKKNNCKRHTRKLSLHSSLQTIPSASDFNNDTSLPETSCEKVQSIICHHPYQNFTCTLQESLFSITKKTPFIIPTWKIQIPYPWFNIKNNRSWRCALYL